MLRDYKPGFCLSLTPQLKDILYTVTGEEQKSMCSQVIEAFTKRVALRSAHFKSGNLYSIPIVYYRQTRKANIHHETGHMYYSIVYEMFRRYYNNR